MEIGTFAPFKFGPRSLHLASKLVACLRTYALTMNSSRKERIAEADVLSQSARARCHATQRAPDYTFRLRAAKWIHGVICNLPTRLRNDGVMIASRHRASFLLAGDKDRPAVLSARKRREIIETYRSSGVELAPSKNRGKRATPRSNEIGGGGTPEARRKCNKCNPTRRKIIAERNAVDPPRRDAAGEASRRVTRSCHNDAISKLLRKQDRQMAVGVPMTITSRHESGARHRRSQLAVIGAIMRGNRAAVRMNSKRIWWTR